MDQRTLLQTIYDTMIAGERYVLIFKGLGITLLIAICAILIGTILGCIFALMKVSDNKIAKAFINRIQNAGFDIGIYCNLNWYNNVLDSELKSKYKIWLARYGKNTGILDLSYKPNKGEFVWQYSSRGRVNGIKGDVDLDVM